MSDGAQIIDEATGRYVFNTPEALSGLTKLYDLKYKYKVAHPGLGTMNENQACLHFLREKPQYISEDRGQYRCSGILRATAGLTLQ
jgi:multiple sugar transport system substrate-binding protein